MIQIFVGVWRTVIVSQTCDFTGPFFGSTETENLSCWSSMHLVLWDPCNIKNGVGDLTMETGPTFTTKGNPGQDHRNAFYHCSTQSAGSLIEILFAFALWCVAEHGAQAAIFQGRLHFDLRNNSRMTRRCHEHFLTFF